VIGHRCDHGCVKESVLLLKRRAHLQFGVAAARFTAAHDNSQIPDEGGSFENFSYKFSIASHSLLEETSLRKAEDSVPVLGQIAWDKATEDVVDCRRALPHQIGWLLPFKRVPNTMGKCLLARFVPYLS